MANSQKQKLVWKIDFSKKKNVVRFVFFCIFAALALACLIWAFVYAVTKIWQPANRFLIAFPILCLIIDFFIGRSMLLSSQPED